MTHLNNEHSYNQSIEKWREIKDLWWKQKVTEYKSLPDDKTRQNKQSILCELSTIDPVIRQTLDRTKATKKEIVYLIKNKTDLEV